MIYSYSTQSLRLGCSYSIKCHNSIMSLQPTNENLLETLIDYLTETPLTLLSSQYSPTPHDQALTDDSGADSIDQPPEDQPSQLCMVGENGGDRGMAYLRGRPWPRLQVLTLGGIFQGANNITDRDCKLLTTVAFPQLIRLQISNSRIMSVGLSHLAKADWPALKHLNLSCNRLQGESVSAISKGGFGSLVTLRMAENQITSEEVTKILTVEWPDLCDIDLRDNRILQSEAQHFAALVHDLYSWLQVWL